MKISFSTLACPTWNLNAVLDAAIRYGYQGVELRFLELDDRLWLRPEFRGSGLRDTRSRLADAGLAISCVDTSCFFHHPEVERRREALEMGRRMMELAAELGAPAIRVFGDRVQPGADRASTVNWIADGVRELGCFGAERGVQCWLETHGDFAPSGGTQEILQQAGHPNLGVIWDPANAYAESGEEPRAGYANLGERIRHVHVKDCRPPREDAADRLWEPVLMGDGRFPAADLIRLLRAAKFEGFASFEWEKRWHPEIAEPEVALPHFMAWMRRALEA